MGKKLVMRQDTTYTPSAVYGFEWVEEPQFEKAESSKREAIKKSWRKNRAQWLDFFARHSLFIRTSHCNA